MWDWSFRDAPRPRIEGREVIDMNADDLFYVPAGPPGHDSWVVGDEPYVSFHFLGASAYATQKR